MDGTFGASDGGTWASEGPGRQGRTRRAAPVREGGGAILAEGRQREPVAPRPAERDRAYADIRMKGNAWLVVPSETDSSMYSSNGAVGKYTFTNQ